MYVISQLSQPASCLLSRLAASCRACISSHEARARASSAASLWISVLLVISSLVASSARRCRSPAALSTAFIRFDISPAWPRAYIIIIVIIIVIRRNSSAPDVHIQVLSYRKQIARQLCTQYVEGKYRPKYYTVTLKSRSRVTQGHWKRNHWIDHTRLTISRVIWRWILSWPWNVCYRSLKVIENGAIRKLGTASYSPSIVTMAVSLTISEIFSIKEWPDLEIWVWVVQSHWKWRRLIDHMRLSIGPPL